MRTFFFQGLGMTWFYSSIAPGGSTAKAIESTKTTVADLGLDMPSDMRITPDVRDMLEHVQKRYKELTKENA